jgi:monofunctional biosynthetic peptidoglycan transglycosylase
MPVVIDFEDEGEAVRWHPVDDRVMGGVSRSEIRSESGAGVFAGELTLTNGAGFASVRREPEPMRLSGHTGLKLEVRGDGRRYQLRLYTHQLDGGAAYRARFQPQAGEWQRIELHWSDFTPVFRGRVLHDAPPMESDDIQQIGLLIADRRDGPFRLEFSRLETLDDSTPRQSAT